MLLAVEKYRNKPGKEYRGGGHWVLAGKVNLTSKNIIDYLVRRVRRAKVAIRLTFAGKPLYTGKYNAYGKVAVTNNVKGGTRLYGNIK